MENNYQYNQYNPGTNSYYYQPPQPQVGYAYGQYQQPMYQPPYQFDKPKKEYRILEKKDTRMMLAMLILSFLFFDLAIFNGFHLGYTIFYILFFIASAIYLPNKKPSIFAFCTGALSVAGSITFSISSNNLIKFFMFILISGLYALFAIDVSDSWNLKKGSFKALIDVVLSYVLYPLVNLPDLFGSIKASTKRKKKLIAVLIGIAVALPPLTVIVTLLVKSDAAFEGLVTTIFKNIGLVIFELVLAILFAPYLISLQFGKKNKLNKRENITKNYQGSVPATIGISFLSVISITYVVYLVSQLAYFFSAFEGILPDDYEKTASAFARRGFFEMFAICVINVLLISIVSFLTKKTNNKLSVGIKGLSCFISVFSFVLIITALTKMKLNIETYGFTANRLLVSTFILMVFFAILFFIIHIFAPKVNYIQPLIVICAALYIALAFVNVDAFVANYNVRAYQDGRLESVDIDSIDTVAGIPYIIELTEDKNEKVANEAANNIVNKLNWGGYNDIVIAENDDTFEQSGEYSISKNFDFRRYSYTEYESYKYLVNYANSLDRKDRKALEEKSDAYWESDWEYYDYVSYDDDSVLDDVTDELGIDVHEGNVLENMDSHSDVQNDGTYYAQIEIFKNSDFVNVIESSSEWEEMPLPKNIDRAVYGEVDDDGWSIYDSVLSGITDLPEIENGYYFLKDESPYVTESEKEDVDYIPTNFTLAIYNVDTEILYFVEYDS